MFWRTIDWYVLWGTRRVPIGHCFFKTVLMFSRNAVVNKGSVYFRVLYLKINRCVDKERRKRRGSATLLLWECHGFVPKFTSADPSFLQLEFLTKSLFVWTDTGRDSVTNTHPAPNSWWDLCQSWYRDVYNEWKQRHAKTLLTINTSNWSIIVMLLLIYSIVWFKKKINLCVPCDTSHLLLFYFHI